MSHPDGEQGPTVHPPALLRSVRYELAGLRCEGREVLLAVARLVRGKRHPVLREGPPRREEEGADTAEDRHEGRSDSGLAQVAQRRLNHKDVDYVTGHPKRQTPVFDR